MIHYGITPSFNPHVLDEITQFFDNGNSMLQLRDKHADRQMTCDFIEKVLPLAEQYDAQVFLNATNAFIDESSSLLDIYPASGIHAGFSNKLWESIPNRYPTHTHICSCHSQNQIDAAFDASYSAITLSPVFYTLSHPDQNDTLGIETFTNLCEMSPLPVFALGGIKPEHYQLFEEIKNCRGLAAIRAWFTA